MQATLLKINEILEDEISSSESDNSSTEDENDCKPSLITESGR